MVATPRTLDVQMTVVDALLQTAHPREGLLERRHFRFSGNQTNLSFLFVVLFIFCEMAPTEERICKQRGPD